jgi:CRP-like cAMP-binding protein
MPSNNWLLARLPPKEDAHLAPHLTHVSLAQGTVLYDTGEPMTSDYYPITALVSLIISTESSTSIEVGLVGAEGAVGGEAALGATSATSQAIVQIAGTALRMPARLLNEDASSVGPVRELMNRFLVTLLRQSFQSAACNSLHTVERRLCRLLLMIQDRTETDAVPFTQDVLAQMLGVRRERVAVVAYDLQDRGLIRYRRGLIVIRDRPGLEASVCECYAILRAELDRLLRV